ncbi:MAG: LysR family transcriptional regulator [Spirochaetales bacterium]|nr:LysR family transcriptional regulator [Spirochaetales bacterium]
MDITQLRYFQAVAKTENVSRASETLHITQPNLSKSIARLEDELGVQLFEHRKGKISLNEYGRIFLESVERSFSELTTGVQTVQRLYETNQKSLSLACSMDDFMTELLKHFSCQHPEVGIKLFSYPPQTVVEHLLSRSINIAIVSNEIKDSRIVFKLLGRTEFVLLMHKEHSLSSRSKVRISELDGQKFICDTSRMNLSEFKKIFSPLGIELDIPFEVGNSALIYQLLNSQAGIALVPLPMFMKIMSEHKDNDIRIVRISDPVPEAVIGIAYHKDYVFSGAAELFSSFTAEWLKKEEKLLEQFRLS